MQEPVLAALVNADAGKALIKRRMQNLKRLRAGAADVGGLAQRMRTAGTALRCLFGMARRPVTARHRHRTADSADALQRIHQSAVQQTLTRLAAGHLRKAEIRPAVRRPGVGGIRLNRICTNVHVLNLAGRKGLSIEQCVLRTNVQ